MLQITWTIPFATELSVVFFRLQVGQKDIFFGLNQWIFAPGWWLGAGAPIAEDGVYILLLLLGCVCLLWLGVMGTGVSTTVDRRSLEDVGWQRLSVSIWIPLEICVHATCLWAWADVLERASGVITFEHPGSTLVQLSVAPTLGGLGFTRGVWTVDLPMRSSLEQSWMVIGIWTFHVNTIFPSRVEWYTS